MSFQDIDTVFGLFGNIFGATNTSTVSIVGLIALIFVAALAIFINVGFEATAILLMATAFIFIQFGLLSNMFYIIIFIGGAFVLASTIAKLTKR